MLFSLSLLPPDVVDMLIHAGLALILLEVASYIVSLWLLPDSKDRVGDVNILLHTVFQPYLSLYAVKSFFNTTLACSKISDMWYLTSDDSKWVLALGIAHSLVTLVSLFLTTKTTLTYKLQVLSHHVTVVYCFALTALGHGHGFTSLAALSEITSVFLNNVYLFKLIKWDTPVLVAINGLLLWLSFIVFRLIMFPLWIYLYYKIYSGPLWIDIKNDFTEPMQKFWWVGFVANSLLFVLSSVWFVAITRGLLKVVKTALTKDAKKVDWKEIQTNEVRRGMADAPAADAIKAKEA